LSEAGGSPLLGPPVGQAAKLAPDVGGVLLVVEGVSVEVTTLVVDADDVELDDEAELEVVLVDVPPQAQTRSRSKRSGRTFIGIPSTASFVRPYPARNAAVRP
jgi:hypothetical protein